MAARRKAKTATAPAAAALASTQIPAPQTVDLGQLAVSKLERCVSHSQGWRRLFRKRGQRIMRKVLDRWPKQMQGLALAGLEIRYQPPNFRTKRHLRRWLEMQLDTEEPFQSSTLKWTLKILSSFSDRAAEVNLLASIFTDAMLSKAYHFLNSPTPFKRPISDAEPVVSAAEKHRIQRAIWRLHLYTEILFYSRFTA